MPRLRFAVLAIVLVCSTACSDLFGTGAKVKPELRRTTVSSANLVAGLSAPRSSAGAVGSVPWSTNFNITSFRVPIRTVNIAQSVPGSSAFTNPATVYDCPADNNDGCLVELIGTNLDDILGASARTVRRGTYDVTAIQHCKDEGRYHAYVTGSVVVGGVTYYSKTVGNLSATGPAEPVTIEYLGCSGNTLIAGGGLDVADSVSAPIILRLNVDTRDIVWGSPGGLVPAGQQMPGGCLTPSATGAYICTAYVGLVATIGSTAPTVERYRVNGGATFGLVFDGATGQPLGGYARQYYAENQPDTTGFPAASPFRTVTSVGPGVVSLVSWGSGSGSSFTTSSFQRATHTGTYTSADNPTPRPYTAVRLP